ncbi:hypothetical protein E4T38_04774 [Aureobasidium subglaciale]|nr:hypothetical protein E4T38_04774 [Aureobasidium subglaciale]KAI5223122.1 hypothetical protein E4T40_04629 [Aureobasidium subglaciale]KAI5226813.1 hypothetical protein E4T41_04572 [Aureobasidium subglaciale]KAI5262452.1 hypothetical protein E4T46_04458 [Aureobasidium subglaciale]
MLPQPDAKVLRTNPQFAALWRDLTTNKIQRNGVSRDVALNSETVKMREVLHSKRVEIAEKEVLRNAVRHVAFGEDGGLTGELRETAQIVSAQLDGKLSPQDKDIVLVEVEEFMNNIDTIRAAVGSHMEQNMVLLCQILDPTQQQPDPATLPVHAQALQADVEEAKWQLGVKRIELASTLTQLLKTNAQLLQTCIRILEQVVHGSVGRHTRARAEHLATVAQGLEKRLLVARKTIAGQVYDGRAEEQLRSKKDELDSQGAGLRRRLRDREQWLERLEGVAGLREAVEEMERIKGEISRAKEEVGRLERGA